MLEKSTSSINNNKYIRQKIRKDRVEPNSIINKLDLIDIYRIHHPSIVEYTFLLGSSEIFWAIKYTLRNFKA